MSFYGIRLFNYGSMQLAYAAYKRVTPGNQTYVFSPTLVDYVYILNDSSLTIVNQDTQANVTITRANNLVNITSFQNANCTVQSGNTDVELIALLTLKNRDPAHSLNDVTAVDVNGSYMLEAGKAAIVVEGALNVPVGETSVEANSENDIYSVGPRLEDTTLTGTGKVIVFKIV
jgi:hypothetical protein